MKNREFKAALLEEAFIKVLMVTSLLVLLGGFLSLLVEVFARGLPALSLEMITQTTQAGYYLGREGGILQAIFGSICLAGGATLVALLFSLPLAFSLHTYGKKNFFLQMVRTALDILWGIPSIVYGALAFTVMLFLGLHSSLGMGIVTLAFLEIPVMTRGFEEVLSLIPAELEQASWGLGATRLETMYQVLPRQIFPGILSAVQLAFGRGIGDAASVLFTAGYTDRMPVSLARPVASLPLAVYFQLQSPFPEVQNRAYASAMVLMVMVLLLSIVSRVVSEKMGRFVIKS